jgi:hypothetical protein
MANRFERPDDGRALRINAADAGGWVRDDAIGFRGFIDERDALRAAALAHALLTQWLDEPPRPIEGGGRTSTGQSHGIVQWATDDGLYVNGERVGRFVRPAPLRGIGARSFGFELSLPPGSRQFALRLARRLHDTLEALGHRHEREAPRPPNDAA